jgi:hypothetical protein
MSHHTEGDFYAELRRDFGPGWEGKKFSEMPTEMLQRYWDFWGSQPGQEHDVQLFCIAWQLGRRKAQEQIDAGWRLMA